MKSCEPPLRSFGRVPHLLSQRKSRRRREGLRDATRRRVGRRPGSYGQGRRPRCSALPWCCRVCAVLAVHAAFQARGHLAKRESNLVERLVVLLSPKPPDLGRRVLGQTDPLSARFEKAAGGTGQLGSLESPHRSTARARITSSTSVLWSWGSWSRSSWSRFRSLSETLRVWSAASSSATSRRISSDSSE